MRQKLTDFLRYLNGSDNRPKKFHKGTPPNVLGRYGPQPAYPPVLELNHKEHRTREGRLVTDYHGKPVMIHRGIPHSVARAVQNSMRRRKMGRKG